MSFMIKMRFVRCSNNFKSPAMFKLLQLIDLCILFNTSLHLFPNKWLRDIFVELNHPPKTSIIMLYCVILYPLNCCFIFQHRGPYFNTFSS